MEIQEAVLPALCDDDTYKGTALEKWQILCLEASIKLGCPMNMAGSAKTMMEDIGYVDVVQVIYKWPMNRWPADKKMKELGT